MVERFEQLALDEQTPEQIIASAHALGPFVRRFCLVSGGRDSNVVAHRCRDAYDELVFIDTGTALPGVRDFIAKIARFVDAPLRVLVTPRGEYDRLVLGSTTPRATTGTTDKPLGFPGPAMHGPCYARLKEPRLQELTRDAKLGHARIARILLLTGVRRAESKRRSTRPAISKRSARVLANPLLDWSNERTRRYAIEHQLPESDVAALLHRSGECNCGAFAVKGEREELRSLFPEWWLERIAPLEAAARAAGLEHALWGCTPRERVVEMSDELCSDCQLRFEVGA